MDQSQLITAEASSTPKPLTHKQLTEVAELARFASALLQQSFDIRDPLATIELDVMQGTPELYRQALAQVLEHAWVVQVPDAPSTKLYVQPRMR